MSFPIHFEEAIGHYGASKCPELCRARPAPAAPGPASDPMALREDCGRFEAAYAAVLEAGRDSAAVFSGRLSCVATILVSGALL